MKDKTSCLRYARRLMRLHGLRGWKVKTVNDYNELGCCWYAPKTIHLSWPFWKVNSMRVNRDTVLHEIAHALLPPRKRDHDREWKQVAKKIGAIPMRTAKHKNPTRKRRK